MKSSNLSRRHRNLLLGALAAATIAGAIYLLGRQGIGIPCLFYRITGLQCPGCGNTRAVLALMRLDLRAALTYNLMLPVELFYLGWVIFHCCRSYLKGGRFAYHPPKLWLDVAILVSLLIWWIVRNIL